MALSLLDQLLGKCYEFEIFDNEFVKVESAGGVIRIGFKNKKGFTGSWFEPSHPFLINNVLDKKFDWDIRVESPSHDKMMVTFVKGEETHTLTIICTNPGKSPKPIQITWE